MYQEILQELNNTVVHNSFAPSFDTTDNTLNATVITNSAIPRVTEKNKPYILQFSFEKEHVDLSRFEGAPFLKEHKLSLANQIGVVTNAYLSTEQKKLTAKVKLSDNPEHAGTIADIKNGIIRNCSMGSYIFRAIEAGEDENGTPIVLATSWSPYELSAVPSGADKNAHFFNLQQNNRKEDKNMDKVTDVIESKTETLAPQVNADEVIQAERSRIAEINKLAKTFNLAADFADNLITTGADVNQARLSILDEVAKSQKSINTRATTAIDHAEKFRAGLSESFVVRSGLKQNDGKNELLSLTPFEVAQNILRESGKSTSHLSRNEIVKLAYQTSSDYQYACSNLVQTGLDLGLTEEVETWRAWAGVFSFDSMTTQRGTTLNRYETALEVVPEAAEFKNITRSETSETYTPKKIGGISAMSWEMLQNDTLGLFAEEVKELGLIVSKTLSDAVYNVLFANAALSDGIALFHSSHKNLTTTAVSVSSLSAAKTLMTKNRAIPKFLIVPVGIEDAAFTLINAVNDPAVTSGVSPNPHTKRFEVVSDYRLDDNSASIWYVAAANAVKVGFLQGQQKPIVETQDGFRIAGVEYRVMLPFAVYAPTYRTLVRSSGV